MPRQSIEAKAAAAWRNGRGPPDPPGYLSKAAKSLWVDIVNSKPADWFSPGSLPLLEMYVELTVLNWNLVARLGSLPSTAENDRLATKLENRIHKFAAALVALATKLRLTVQASVDRHSRMLDERGSPVHPLLGGKH